MKRSTLILLKTVTWIACLWPCYPARLRSGDESILARPKRENRTNDGLYRAGDPDLFAGGDAGAETDSAIELAHQVSRLLGLFAFFYATVHLLTWVALYSGFNVQAMTDDLLKRRFIYMGMFTLAAAAAAGAYLDKLVDSQAGRQTLEPAAHACLRRGDLRRLSITGGR